MAKIERRRDIGMRERKIKRWREREIVIERVRDRVRDRSSGRE